MGIDGPLTPLGEAAGSVVMDIGSVLPSSLIGVIIGWGLGIFTRPLQDACFGSRFVIDCEKAPGKIAQGPNAVYMKFRVRNTRKRSIARNCRAYIISIHEVRNNRVMPDDLKPDSAQLPWEGGDFEPRDIPHGASQYADIVHFSKDQNNPGWIFRARPNYIANDQKLKAHRGTYRISVLVAGDGVKSATKNINIDYNGDWNGARPYDA
jgi:hypothetical protein